MVLMTILIVSVIFVVATIKMDRGLKFLLVVGVFFVIAAKLPNFRSDYRTMAKISESVTTSAPVRNAVDTACRMAKLVAGMPQTDPVLGLNASTTYVSVYVKKVAVVVTTSTSAAVTATFPQIDDVPDNSTITWTLNCIAGTSSWVITGTVPSKFLPKLD